MAQWLPDAGKKIIYASLGCALLAAVFFAHWFLADSSPFVDEGDHATTGQIILRGGMMYRDAFNEKGPGLYWLTAGLFKFFGERFVVLRYAAAATALLTLILLMAAGAMFGHAGSGLIAALIYSAFHLLFLGEYWQPESVLTPLALAVIVVLTVRNEEQGPAAWRMFVAGLLLFGATLVKQNAWLFVAALAILIIYARFRNKTFFSIASLAGLFAGLVGSWLLLFLWLRTSGGWDSFAEGYLFPLTSFSTKEAWYLPRLNEFFLELPVWWMMLAAFWALPSKLFGKWNIRLLLLVLAVELIMIFPAPYIHHFLPVLAVSALGFTLALPADARQFFRQRNFMLPIFTLLCLGAAGQAPRQYQLHVGRFETRQWEEVAAAVVRDTTAEDRIFVFPFDSTYYFLTDRLPPGRFGFLLPWTTPPPILAQFLAEFRRQPPKVILYTYLSNYTPVDRPPKTYLGPLIDLISSQYVLNRIFPNRVALFVRLDDPAARNTVDSCIVNQLMNIEVDFRVGINTPEDLILRVRTACRTRL